MPDESQTNTTRWHTLDAVAVLTQLQATLNSVTIAYGQNRIKT